MLLIQGLLNREKKYLSAKSRRKQQSRCNDETVNCGKDKLDQIHKTQRQAITVQLYHNISNSNALKYSAVSHLKTYRLSQSVQHVCVCRHMCILVFLAHVELLHNLTGRGDPEEHKHPMAPPTLPSHLGDGD